MCLDPKALNENIRRPYYPMRSIDDITSKLNGAKYFSVLDATKGYWSIKLEKNSSMLTTFNTHLDVTGILDCRWEFAVPKICFSGKLTKLSRAYQLTSICDDVLVSDAHEQNMIEISEMYLQNRGKLDCVSTQIRSRSA